MTTFRTFASGSSGNAALAVSGETRVLIDMASPAAVSARLWALCP